MLFKIYLAYLAGDLALFTKIPLVLLALFGLSGCLGQTASSQPTARVESIETLRDRLSSVRDLKFIYEVPIAVQTKDTAKDYVEGDRSQKVARGTSKEVSLAYAKLGLLPPPAASKANSLSFYSSHTLAFYDSRTKKVVLIRNPDGRSGGPASAGDAEKVIVHELTHALQDQHFSLGERLQPLGNSDTALALRAVAEGDAILTEYAYSFGGLHDWVPGYVRQVLDGGGEHSTSLDLPVIVAEKLIFQYLAGARFVSRFPGEHDWRPVNLLYKHPPLSTEQVLHPEKYLEAPDPPVRITLNGLSRLFSPEWKEIESDTLGELMVLCLFKQFLGLEEAAVVAAGWGGDRFVAYQNGEETAFVWATFWDSENDAGEFYEKYQKVLSMKYGPPSADTRFYIEKRERSVIVIEGLDPDRVSSNIETVWSSMILKEEHFQPPSFGYRIGSR